MGFEIIIGISLVGITFIVAYLATCFKNSIFLQILFLSFTIIMFPAITHSVTLTLDAYNSEGSYGDLSALIDFSHGPFYASMSLIFVWFGYLMFLLVVYSLEKWGQLASGTTDRVLFGIGQSGELEKNYWRF